MKFKRKVSRTLYYSLGISREGEVIGSTVFMAPTRESLIPIKSPEKQPVLMVSHRSVETGKLQDTKTLNHVLLTNTIPIWSFPLHRTSFLLLTKEYIWGAALWLGVWSSQSQEYESLHAWWDQPWTRGVPSLLQPMGTGAACTRVLRAL